MQHINDDMDELYRHAAEDYPLKIKEADWESVAKRLNDGEDEKAVPLIMFPSNKGGTGKKYRYLLLLLIIPAALLTAKYTGLPGGGDKPAENAVTSAATTNTNSKETAKQSTTPSDAVAAPAGDIDEKLVGANSVAVTKPVTQAGAGKNRQMAVRQAIDKQNEPAAQGVTSHTPGLAELGAITRQQNMQQAMDKLHANTAAETQLQPGDSKIGNKIGEAPIAPAAAATVKEDQAANEDNIVKVKQHDQPTAESATAANDNPDNATGPVTVKKPKRFYVGLYIAPDYTTVKYQPGNKVGFDFAGLAGYKISKNLSVEAGISIDKKYYTSDGKYYNSVSEKQQQWLRNKGTLLNISGYSNLTSFPVTLKYDFKPGRDGNFFVAGGIVSYIVHEENYKYQFSKDNIIYTTDKSTKISTTNMLANISISAGYESALGNFCNFRIEPYYRMPLKGIGLGGLPITSMGLNIGLTKKIR